MEDTKKVLDELKQTVAEAAEAAVKGKAETFENALADYDKRFAEQERKFDAAIADMKTAALGIGGSSPENSAERKAFNAYIRRGEVSDALTTSSNADGGFLVPAPVATEIIRLSTPGNPLRELGENVTVSGDYTFLAETGIGEAGWVGETDERAETAGPQFAQQTVPVREVYAMPAVSRKLIDDAAFDVESVVFEAAARKFAAVENSAFFNGAGQNQPQGIMTVPTVADASWEYGKIGFVKSGSASAITADGLIDAQDALASEYRDGEERWLMSKSTWSAVRKLKQGNSGADKYLLWTPELIEGRIENVLLGSRVRIASAMPEIAANAFPVAYGNFRRAYVVVDRIGLRLLRDEYTRKGFVRMYFTRYVGGGVKNFEAVKFVKISA